MLEGHTARKRFGQNFLVNQQIIAAIISTVHPQAGQRIVEIGPGQGAITKLLVATKAQIDAIEIDRDLAEYLSEVFAKNSNFQLHVADILKFNINSLITDTKTKLRIVGNLPYNISTPLLFKLFTATEHICDMHFMLQREVAERLIASPNCKAYGRMSIMAQYYCDMQIMIDVPPTAFDPQPKVESSVVRFTPHVKPQVVVSNTKLLQQVTTQAFNQRRKTISNALKALLTSAEIQALDITPTARAENLSLQNYASITNYIASKLEPEHK